MHSIRYRINRRNLIKKLGGDIEETEKDKFKQITYKKFNDLSSEEQEIFKNNLESEVNKKNEFLKKNNKYIFSKLSLSIIYCHKHKYDYFDIYPLP